MDLNVFSFLQKYQIGKGGEHTHTSFIKPTGAFYIPVNAQDAFIDLYKTCIKKNEYLYITEKHRDLSPILIDLDFRYEKENTIPIRHHTPDDIKLIVQNYLSVLEKYVVIPDDLAIYVMEKPAPVIDKVYVKDGIHIVIPDIVTKPTLQYILRNELIALLPVQFAHLPLKNSWDDVIDNAIIEKNNWMMYGSRKPNAEPYKITYIFDKNMELLPINEDHTTYVDILSIRNKFDLTEVTPAYEEVEIQYEAEKERQARKQPVKMSNVSIFQSYQNIKKNTVNDSDSEYIKKLVNILDIDRANNYQKWVRLGWCLRNIDYRLLEVWIEFSQRSPKFQEGECEKMWNYMKDDGLNIGSLHLWAKEDNPDEYKNLIKRGLQTLLNNSVSSGTHTDIAEVVHYMYKYEYVCVSIKNNCWYEFRNHRWMSCDSGFSLRNKISKELCDVYYNYRIVLSQNAALAEDDDTRKGFDVKLKKLGELIPKLKTCSFKDNIMKESREIFYIEKFEEKLDSRCHLVGFENGVFDLESYEFREGRPEDYISFTSGVNYNPYIEDDNARDLHEFINRIFTKPHMKEYFLTLLASFLNGNIKEERFHILTGGGCFAKDTHIMMYDGSDKSVQDVIVGDKLMGDDSTPRVVQQLFRGHSDMYEIIPVKGEKFTVNGDHKLVIKMSNSMALRKDRNKFRVTWYDHTNTNIYKSKSKTFDTKKEASLFLEKTKLLDTTVKENEILILKVNEYLKCPKSFTRVMNCYKPDMVDFEEKEVTLDPYFLGYWLGDGNSYDPAFTTGDFEVVEYIEEYCKEIGCSMSVYDDKGLAKTYGIRGIQYGKNKIRDGLNKYNLFQNKHIPNEYKMNSKKVRMEVLAGIIDSDGHYHLKMKQYEVTLKSEILIDQVIWLARSLGMSCYKSKIKKKCTNTGKIGDYFQTIIVGYNIHEVPVKILRKKAVKRTCIRNPRKVSFKVKKVKDDNFYGFELDGNHLFLKGMGDFTVLSNSNGKSKVLDLFEQSFGDYCCKLPITLLTQKRASSNAATSELARTKGKRFACLQEPSEDEKLNVGLMKELTGGDKIMARAIYKEPIEFKPQFKMVLTCNTLPTVPSNDNGTWRRLRVIEFTSKFVDHPNPDVENEFEMDMDLTQKFAIWKEYFISLLINYYKKYTEGGVTEPEEVLVCTKEYQRNNDVFLDFVEQEFEKNDMTFVTLSQVVNCFKSWVKENNINHVSLKLKELTNNLEKCFGKKVNVSTVVGFKGWQFKNDAFNTNDELGK
jgi:P4 family phage/plasmid primase-like protien